MIADPIIFNALMESDTSILVIFLILYFVLGFFGHADQRINGYSEAVEILKQRYAKGEISEEEYRKKLSEILYR